ncbi:THO complex subunit 1 transcription elongation factor-domain-containing protein [Gaertneriomyces semiglobifer]|nr:THO complex subunit 1 transcription elongation factor-domain-containing protein [Gaertneriomyces semiglobifer]
MSVEAALRDVLSVVESTTADMKLSAIKLQVKERLAGSNPGLLLVAFSACMLDVVAEHPDEDEKLFSRLYDLLDIAVECSEQGVPDPSLPFSVIEDLLDVLTIPSASRIISYLESRSAVLTSDIDPSRGKGLILLRFCNEMLRRLSKTKNNVLSGRILTFMANTFPLSERSGVNLRGEFNTKNVTSFDENGEGLEDAKREFYTTFWGLQKYFTNPLLLTQPEHFETLKTGMDVVLDRFDEINKQGASGLGKGNDRVRTGADGRKRKAGSEEDDAEKHDSDDYFFPKFLTSPNLFELELSDPSFRRHMVSQFCILLQYLSMLSADEKASQNQAATATNLSSTSTPTPASTTVAPNVVINKSVANPYTLTPEQESWVRITRTRAAKISELIHPNGKQFGRNLSTVVTHERGWVEWKNKSCPTYERKPVGVAESGVKPKLAGSEAARREGWLGSDLMTQLWRRGANISDTISQPAKDPLNMSHPENVRSKLDNYLDHLGSLLTPAGQLLPEIEPEYALHTNGNFNWRVLRMAVRSEMGLFHTTNLGVKPSGGGMLQGGVQMEKWGDVRGVWWEWRRRKQKAEGLSENTDEAMDESGKMDQTSKREEGEESVAEEDEKDIDSPGIEEAARKKLRLNPSAPEFVPSNSLEENSGVKVEDGDAMEIDILPKPAAFDVADKIIEAAQTSGGVMSNLEGGHDVEKTPSGSPPKSSPALDVADKVISAAQCGGSGIASVLNPSAGQHPPVE